MLPMQQKMQIGAQEGQGDSCGEPCTKPKKKAYTCRKCRAEKRAPNAKCQNPECMGRAATKESGNDGSSEGRGVHSSGQASKERGSGPQVECDLGLLVCPGSTTAVNPLQMSRKTGRGNGKEKGRGRIATGRDQDDGQVKRLWQSGTDTQSTGVKAVRCQLKDLTFPTSPLFVAAHDKA